jgi:hypothetical protein
MRPRLDLGMALLLGAVGVCLWRLPTWHSFAIFCLVASAVFVLILVAAFVVIPPVVFRLQPKFRDDDSLIFSPQGIHFRTAQIDSNLQWSLYSRVLIDAHSYLLYYGSRTFTVIPKRVFRDTEQQRGFEQLLSEQVPKIVTK